MAEVSEAGTRCVLTILPTALIRHDTEQGGQTARINRSGCWSCPWREALKFPFCELQVMDHTGEPEGCGHLSDLGRTTNQTVMGHLLF